MNRIKAVLQKCWQYEIVHAAVYSALLNMLVECFNRRSLIGLVMIFTNPVLFLYNTLIILVTMSIVLLFHRKVFVYCTVSVVWILLAVTNFVVLCSRKTPFTAMDIYLIEDAIKVIPVYLNVFQMILIVLAVAAGIAGLVWLWIKGPKQQEKIHYIRTTVKIGLLLLCCMGVTHFLLLTGTISSYFGNLANAYKQYGFAYCFTCSVVDRGISKSDEYTPEYVNSLKEDIEEIEVENSEKSPNIIFLQLESFFDPNLVKGISFSENPLPYFEQLVAEYPSGYLSVPCFGAGTANTEFEVQTGMNMDDFGPGEYPYKTVLQSKVCESMAYDLKEKGYATHALHDNDGTFYDRYKVFSHLGYEDFTSIEYMDNIEMTPMGWAKDKILTGEIGKILDSTDGSDYIYTISVQGHGDYPAEYPEGFVPEITVTGFFDTAKEKAFTYYVNQIHEMDNFLQELTAMLESRDEETVLVMSEGYLTKFHQKRKDTPDYLKDLKILEYDILYGNCDLYGGENPFQATNLIMGQNDITITNAYNYKDYVCVEGSNFNDYSVVYINDKAYPTEIINSHLLRVEKAQVTAGNIVSVVQQGDDKIELSRVYLQVGESENK